MTDIFSGYRLGGLQLANRIVMAPMTRNRATTEASPTPSMATYYAQRAGAGLIVTEGTQPSAVGQGYPRTPGLHTDEQVEGWRAVADAVHAEGGVIFAQIMHAGRISHPKVIGTTPVAPSAVTPAGEVFTGAGHGPVRDAARAGDRGASRARRGVRRRRPPRGRGRPRRCRAARAPTATCCSSSCRRLQPAHRRLRRYAGEPRPLRGRGGPGRRGRDRRATGSASRVSPNVDFNDNAETEAAETYAALLDGLKPLGLAYLHVIEDIDGTDARRGPRAAGGLRGHRHRQHRLRRPERPRHGRAQPSRPPAATCSRSAGRSSPTPTWWTG